MEDLAEINGRLSILSSKGSIKEEEVQKYRTEPPPPDALFFVHLLLFLLGLMTVMPISFFITANDYWMFKFRDPSSHIIDPTHKTTLQKNFAPVQLVASAAPTLISNIIFTRYAHKMPLRRRGLIALSILLTAFLVFTAFININTDNWQVAFFSMTMLTVALINATVALFQFTALVVASKFPMKFMMLYTYGQGSAGVFNGSLQTICIAVGGGDSQKIALIYFITGSLVIALTLILFAVSNRIPLFQYYNGLSKEDTQRPPRTWTELKPVMRKMWTIQAILFSILLSMYLCHPTISVLVVSEYYSKGGKWSTSYFIPVITFLYSDLMSLSGRFLARKPLMTEKNGAYWVAASVARMAIFFPMFLLCNAHPRHNLPVVFHHDWQYIIIVGVFSLTAGYMSTLLFLGASTFNLDEKQGDMVYELIQLMVGVSQSLLSPLALVIVNVL